MPAAAIRCHVQRARRTSRIKARDGRRVPVMRAALIATSRPTSSAAAEPTRTKYPAATLSGSRKRTSAASVAISAATSMASATAGGAATSRHRGGDVARRAAEDCFAPGGWTPLSRATPAAGSCVSESVCTRRATYTVFPGSTAADAACMTTEALGAGTG